MTNLDYDLITEGLTLLIHDRCSMPKEMPEFLEKMALVADLYNRIQETRREVK